VERIIEALIDIAKLLTEMELQPELLDEETETTTQ